MRKKLEGFHLNLGKVQMEGADLTRVHLELGNLEGARLEGANLTRAYLKGANLADAHLEGANLGRTYLEGANLKGAKLEQAYFGSGQDLSKCFGLHPDQVRKTYYVDFGGETHAPVLPSTYQESSDALPWPKNVAPTYQT